MQAGNEQFTISGMFCNTIFQYLAFWLSIEHYLDDTYVRIASTSYDAFWLALLISRRNLLLLLICYNAYSWQPLPCKTSTGSQMGSDHRRSKLVHWYQVISWCCNLHSRRLSYTRKKKLRVLVNNHHITGYTEMCQIPIWRWSYSCGAIEK